DAAAPPRAEQGPDFCVVRAGDGRVSASIALHGFAEAALERFEGQNAHGRFAAAPVLVSPGSLRSEGVFVALHLLTRDPGFSVDAARRAVLAVEVERRIVRITCRDGAAYWVQLVAADEVDEDWGGTRLAGAVRFARRAPDGACFVWRG